jgi:hypothetical protein
MKRLSERNRRLFEHIRLTSGNSRRQLFDNIRLWRSRH